MTRPTARAAVGLALAAATAAAIAAVLWFSHTPVVPDAAAPPMDAATVARGAYLARLGNCAACHTARGGAPYAGGRGLATPFGTVYSGNLTPDDETGLGRWSVSDFWRALHHGRAPDGRLLSPAFPYPNFTLVSRPDSDALYAYLRSLAPLRRPRTENTLRFPFNTQAAMAVWRALYFRPSEVEPKGASPAATDAERGVYLVRGLGHCAACHAPRDAFGATRRGDELPGGAMPSQAWYAPDLAPNAQEPLTRQRQNIVDLLRTGMAAHGTAGGPMAEVVVGSTQHWTTQDLQAVAVHLTGLPAQPARADDRTPPSALVAEQVQRGQRLYADQCAQCHGAQGQGFRGAYPPLAGNPTVTLDDAGNLLQAIRHGGFAPATASNPRPYGMPPAGLDAQALADVATFIRQAWGNRAAAVTVQQSMRAP